MVRPINRRRIFQLGVFISGFVGCMLLGLDLQAQERVGTGQEESYRSQNQDELNPRMTSPGDHVVTPQNSSTTTTSNSNREKETQKDALQVEQPTIVKSKPDSTEQKKTEEETLSFNLLYFIIQKFKVSDNMMN